MTDTTLRAHSGFIGLHDQSSGSANERDTRSEVDEAIAPSEFSLAMRTWAHQGSSAISEHVT